VLEKYSGARRTVTKIVAVVVVVVFKLNVGYGAGKRKMQSRENAEKKIQNFASKSQCFYCIIR
jgi:hypothetical protein